VNVFRKSLVAACLWIILPCTASAVTGNQPGDLAIHIAVSDSPGYIEQWVSTPFRAAVTIHRIREVARGKTAYIAFLVTGQSSDPGRRSKVDVGVRVLRPDRSVAFADTSYAHISRRNDGRIGFTMADPALDFGVESNDPVGQWMIEATAHDRVTGAKASATYPLVVRQAARLTR
jgi:hypothetical protein